MFNSFIVCWEENEARKLSEELQDWRDLQSTGEKTRFFHLLSLSGLWIFMAIIVDPRGDFPLNDDWSFGSMVRGWVTNGDLRSAGPGAMTRIFRDSLGALFCFPFWLFLHCSEDLDFDLGLGRCPGYLRIAPADANHPSVGFLERS